MDSYTLSMLKTLNLQMRLNTNGYRQKMAGKFFFALNIRRTILIFLYRRSISPNEKI